MGGGWRFTRTRSPYLTQLMTVLWGTAGISGNVRGQRSEEMRKGKRREMKECGNSDFRRLLGRIGDLPP